MSGDCYEDDGSTLEKEILLRLQDLGAARQKLKTILDEDVFENLSKHDPYWSSEHSTEDDRLHDIRMKLTCLQDNLWDLQAILNGTTSS